MKKIFLLTLVAVSLFGINNSAQAQNFKLGIDGLTFRYNDKEVPLSEMAIEEASDDSNTRVKLTPCINVSKTKLYVWTNGISSIPSLICAWAKLLMPIKETATRVRRKIFFIIQFIILS